MGKTSFALGAASNVAIATRRPVIFFSMEMGAVELTKRMLSSEARVEDWFAKENVVEKGKWRDFLAGQHKKSDLCDALCMCLDFVVRTETV
jgi:replicative DNA helicase